MYLPGEQPIAVEMLVKHYHRTIETLNSKPFWQGKTINLLPGANACQSIAPGQLARVESGLIYVNWGNRTAFVLQRGDFLFHFNAFEEQSLHYLAEEPASIQCIDTAYLTAQLATHEHSQQQWQNLLLIQCALFANAYGASMQQGIRPAAGFQRFSAGEVIIREGEPAEHVYTLLKGEAVASVKSVPVGTINENEIFGALAAITGSHRGATVVAHSNCTVMAVPKVQFIELIKSQPETCLKMIETMAYQISELNSRVSGPIESSL